MKAYKNYIQILKEERSLSGLVTHAATDHVTGKVTSVGGEVEEIKEGDTVQFHLNKSVQADHAGKKYYYVHQDSILAYEKNSKRSK